MAKKKVQPEKDKGELMENNVDLMEVSQGEITCYNSTKRPGGSKSRGITSYNSTKRCNHVDLMEVSQGELPVIKAQRDLMEVGQGELPVITAQRDVTMWI